MTKAQAESPSGRTLIDLILTICHDYKLDISEIENLHIFLRKEDSHIPAFVFLRAITRDCVADGRINETEAYHLKKAFERVVPKEARGVVSTHLADIGLPTLERGEPEPRWTRDPATARQIDYIVALGGHATEDMTKGEASKLIEALLDRRPPTPRQMMLLRFFDRVELQSSDKDTVSNWIDEIFAGNLGHEQAWERFKQETKHNPYGQDPLVVPIGAYAAYMRRPAEAKVVNAKSRTGCLPSMTIFITCVFAIAWMVRGALVT